MNNKSLQYKKIHTKDKRSFLNEKMQEVADKIHSNFDKTNKVKECPCCASKCICYYTVKFGFSLDFCKNCGHIFTNPFPSNEALVYYYNSSFKEFENQFFIDSFENRLPIFFQRLDLIEGLRCGNQILDVGSAVGIFLEANIKTGSRFDITACDLNRSACEYLKERYPTSKVINENIVDLEEGEYDVVTLWDTFEHIPDPAELLDAIQRQISSSGYFLFSTPNTNSFEWQVMGDSHVQLLPPGHVNLYNTENVTGLLKRHGFSVVDIKTMNPTLDLSYVLEMLKSSRSESRFETRAALSLMEVVLSPENLPIVEKFMRNKLMAGNMIVVAQKNV